MMGVGKVTSAVIALIAFTGCGSGPRMGAGSPTNALSITTVSLPGGAVGATYSANLAATGGIPPYSWSVAAGSLPTGLSLSASGAITGTPTVAGAPIFSTRVTDAASSPATANATLSMNIQTKPATPSEPLSGALLTGMTARSYSVPAGWNLAVVEGFENGSLGPGEALASIGSSISSSFSHTGTHAEVGTYSGDGAQVGWYTPPLPTREVEVSWWEFDESQGLFNDEMFMARFLTNQAGTSSPLQDITVDWYFCEFVGCPNGGFNTPVAPLSVVYNSYDNGIHGVFGNSYGSGGTTPHSPDWGNWTQWEIHMKTNTPNVSDGEYQIFKNGALVTSATGLNMNGDVEMNPLIVEVGGIYTKITWHLAGTTICANSMTQGGASEIGPRVTNFNNCNPCSNQCPPKGVVPVFKRYIDDIIVVHK